MGLAPNLRSSKFLEIKMISINKLRKVVAGMMVVMLSGCATLRDSLIVGGVSGATSGALVGTAIHQENNGSGALIGAAVGLAVGGISSYFIHKGLENRDSHVRKDTLFGLEKFGVSDVPSRSSSVPAISFNVIEEQKIETHRTGNKVTEAHRVWILSDDSNVHYDMGSEKGKK